MRIPDPNQSNGYTSRGFRNLRFGETSELTYSELENYESFILSWIRSQTSYGLPVNRVELRKLIEGVREKPLSDFEFGMFLDYFKDGHDIEIPD